MVMRGLVVVFAFLLISQTAVAGENYSGWGETPEEAMEAAMARATKDSPGGCVCKGWGPDIEEVCKVSKLGGFTCMACGSNHKGSCESQAELDKIIEAAGKLKGLLAE